MAVGNAVAGSLMSSADREGPAGMAVRRGWLSCSAGRVRGCIVCVGVWVCGCVGVWVGGVGGGWSSQLSHTISCHICVGKAPVIVCEASLVGLRRRRGR